MKRPLLFSLGCLLLVGARFAPLPAVFPTSSKPFKIEIPRQLFSGAPAKNKADRPITVREMKKKQKPFSELEMRFRAERVFSISA